MYFGFIYIKRVIIFQAPTVNTAEPPLSERLQLKKEENFLKEVSSESFCKVSNRILTYLLCKLRNKILVSVSLVEELRMRAESARGRPKRKG